MVNIDSLHRMNYGFTFHFVYQEKEASRDIQRKNHKSKSRENCLTFSQEQRNKMKKTIVIYYV